MLTLTIATRPARRWTFTLALVLLGLTPSWGYERLQGPTELLHADAQRAQAGYTLFGARGTTWLLDLQGQVVHTWPVGTNPHLLDNGHLLDASRDDPSGTSGFKEVDWDGRVVWEYTERRAGYAPHHDWVRIQNRQLNAPTTLFLANRSITHEQAIAAGANPANGPYREAQMDAVVEVDQAGTVVWEWWFFDHVVQDLDAGKPHYVGAGKTVADYPGRINLNLPGKPLRRDWLHCNSIDYNPTLDQIVVNSVQGELYVIDHGGTFVAGDPAASLTKAAGPAGDFLYRFGDPARYGQGDPPSIGANWDAASAGHKQMGGAHHVSWIPPGLPGAGHLLIFNNGQYLYQRTPSSEVLEVNPYLDAAGRDTGHYVNPPEAGYRRVQYDKDTHNQPRQVSNQVVWCYRPRNSHGFFSHIGSSAQRLPNGNTFICSDTEGHLFEVTTDGAVVWEYLNPTTPQGAVKVLGDVLPMTNSVFRAFRLTPDHPALQGRTLTARGTITGTAPSPVATGAVAAPPPAQGGQPGGQQGQGGGQRNQGPPRREPDHGQPRRPWILQHAAELDTDHDGAVSREEPVGQATSTFAAYDQSKDGRIDQTELGVPGGVRSALGGFVVQHAKELDANGDGFIASAELQEVVLRMFDKADADRDGRLAGAELATAEGK